MSDPTRLDVAIESVADALLSICALQTGTDPLRAVGRAMDAIATIAERGLQEQEGGE
jgi:hypothetical protein